MERRMNEIAVTDADIIGEHKLAQTSAKSAVEHAVNCGRMLNEKKPTIQHGGWTAWLESVGIPERAARRYMKAAKNFGIGKTDAASDLTLDSLLGTERKAGEKKVKQKAAPAKISWQAIAIDHKLMSGASGGSRQTVKAKLMELEPSLVFDGITEGSSEHVAMVAACERLAGDSEDWREGRSHRQISKTESAIEAEVQERVTEGLQSMLDMYNKENEKHRRVVSAYKGIISEKDYKILSSALHSDKYPDIDDVQRGRLDKAFAIIRDKKLELCGDNGNGNGNGNGTSLPKTVAELMAMRRR
jgi:hypothetical protein